MRYFAIFLLLFASISTLPACAQKTTTHKTKGKQLDKKASKKAPAPEAQAQPEPEAEPALTFERTPCFGTCPAYKMQVFADGHVAYEGRRAMPMMGKKNLQLPSATVADMLHQAQDAHFDQFQNRYSRNTTDLPSIIITIRQPNGQLKTVVVEEGEPDNVRTFVTSLTQQFDALAQLGGVEK